MHKSLLITCLLILCQLRGVLLDVQGLHLVTTVKLGIVVIIPLWLRIERLQRPRTFYRGAPASHKERSHPTAFLTTVKLYSRCTSNADPEVFSIELEILFIGHQDIIPIVSQ